MSDTYNDVQKLTVDPIIELWELEIGTSSYAYFYSGLDANLQEVQFRNRNGGSPINTYDALPIQGEGFALKSDGAIVRPTLTVANILSTFSDALGGLTNKDLLGKRLYRRRTLQKYLYSEGETADPAIEFPMQMFYVDRIANESRFSVTFELSAPYDLTGVTLPRRTIIGNGCSWKYQGADPTLAVGQRVGGCTWRRDSFWEPSGGSLYPYVNKKDEPIVFNTAVIATYTSQSVSNGGVYRTTAPSSVKQINKDGTITAPSTTVYDYWQAIGTNSSPGFPTDNNANWRRVWIYAAYSSSSAYYVYTDPQYNTYTTRSVDSVLRMWQVKKYTQTANNHDTAPQINAYWRLGDECGKTLNSCNMRFNHTTVTSNGVNVPDPTVTRNSVLPFGGFPGARFT